MDAVGSMYGSDVKQHSEYSNFPNADVTSGKFPRLKAGGWGVCRATRQTSKTRRRRPDENTVCCADCEI